MDAGPFYRFILAERILTAAYWNRLKVNYHHKNLQDQFHCE